MEDKKYPRTCHFPWSMGVKKDDHTHQSVGQFIGQKIVATIKFDGENTTMTRERIYARSLDSGDHKSRHLVKAVHGNIKHEIPNGFRICGENLQYSKSIHYKNLPDFFLVFNIWNENNICLSWRETTEWCELIGLTPVTVIYNGVWDEKIIKSLYSETMLGDEMEGYVVRLAKEFHYDDFDKYVGKFVRADHVRTDTHWMHQELVSNELGDAWYGTQPELK